MKQTDCCLGGRYTTNGFSMRAKPDLQHKKWVTKSVYVRVKIVGFGFDTNVMS